MREAGATAAQELAFTLANAIAYVEAAIERGLAVDDVRAAPELLLRGLERAVRGGRQVPGRPPDVGPDRARPVRPRSPLDAAGSTSRQRARSLTAQSVDNNVVRTTLQALSAVLGGAQSLHTNSRDEALALPTAEAARLALRTQQILAYEAGVTETPDPLGGPLLRRVVDR